MHYVDPLEMSLLKAACGLHNWPIWCVPNKTHAFCFVTLNTLDILRMTTYIRGIAMLSQPKSFSLEMFNSNFVFFFPFSLFAMMTNTTKSWMSESDSSYFVFHTVIELICLAEANTNLTFCRIATRWFFNLCAYCAVFIDKLFTSVSKDKIGNTFRFLLFSFHICWFRFLSLL